MNAASRAFAFVAFVVLFAPVAARPRAAQPPQAPASPEPAIDVIAVDRDGRPVDKLAAADFSVTVDGARRAVTAVRYVARGPGAAGEAAARLARGEEPRAFAAEPARNVVVVVDEASVPRGAERDLVAPAGAFLDRLGLDDRVAVVRLPLSAGAAVALTTERPEARQALAAVAGRLVPQVIADPAAPPPVVSADQERMTGLEPGQPVRVETAPGERADAEVRGGARGLAALRSLFLAMRRMPGRKVVAVFSAGVSATSNSVADEAAAAALAAHATVYAFGARSSAGADTADFFGTSVLERLAVATGGAFVGISRNPEKAVERAVGELAGCYVLALESGPPPPRAGRRQVKVEIARKGVTPRAPAWLTAQADPEDLPVSAAQAASSPAAAALSVPFKPSQPPARQAELQLALARLFTYADGYERQYSMLVAEEDYRQSAPKGAVRTRSDLLLVRPGVGDEWVSFRDVFEVDGRPVRDREERLRRLFLEGTPEALARLDAIRDESSRYNIGSVERTINVPLLPLTFLRAANRDRFEYELAGTAEVGGSPAWRVRYAERAHPTMIGDMQGGDLPASGHFLVDTITGAIVESRLEARRGESRAEIVVKYRSDPSLGLWVPADMRETYSMPEAVTYGRSSYVNRSSIEGHATYSNFRRFQVKTEEKVK